MHRHRVLLIEDEAELAELLGELLCDFDYDVRLAGTIGEAEEHLAGFSPCAVVTDLTLPDVAREEVVERLRAYVGGTPIVLMSAISPAELRRFAEEHGAQGAIPKPFDLEEFEKTVLFQCPETEHAPAP